MDVWNYILGYRNTLKSVFETWVVHIPFNFDLYAGAVTIVAYNTRFCETVNCKLQVC